MMTEEKVTGWDFSYLTSTGRMAESPLPWNYYVKICAVLAPGMRLLDLGTGGGEFLSLLPGKDRLHIYATEGYAPNQPIARRRLAGFGATLVTDYSDEALPFEDNFFDVVTDRHESYDLQEVYRVLKPGGRFITQQVGGASDLSLANVLQVQANEEFLHWNLAYALGEFEGSAFRILEAQENEGYTRFYDADAVLYYVRSMPYLFHDYGQFDFDHIARLLAAHFAANPYLDIRKDRFLLVAEKPGAPAL